MKLVEMKNAHAGIADLDGVRHEVDLSLIESPALGDYLIVHAGFAIERLDREEADLQLRFFAELAGTKPGAGPTVRRPAAP